MTTNNWLQLIAAAMVVASAPSAQAQGKGKATGKGAQKQEHVAAKVEKSNKKGQEPIQTVQQRGKSDNNGQAQAMAKHEARAIDERIAVPKGKGLDKLPASANASPRIAYAADAPRGHAYGRYARDLTVREIRPSMQRYVVSTRPAELVTGGALAYALARGIPENALVIAPSSRDVWIRNRSGAPLLVLDDDRARNLGVWQTSPVVEPVRAGAPSFCRSGEGHPVWGRQWCLQKGFGLGDPSDYQWAAARDIGDVVFTRPVVGTLTRDALFNVLGQVAFDRLALHALTLGYAEPLTGVWRTEPGNPGLLVVNSGRWPVAELVDQNGDQRPDLMLVALKPW